MRAHVLGLALMLLFASAPDIAGVDCDHAILDSRSGPPAVVEYQLDVHLDPAEKSLAGRGVVRFTNTTDRATDELRWHLYLNAFRNTESSFQREDPAGWPKPRSARDPFGAIDVLEMSTDGVDLLAGKTFEHPDDDNDADRTVLRTPLPKPLEPGATIEVKLAFSAMLPPVRARSGYAGSFFMVAQWFPKLGVLARGEDGASRWICHQYHRDGEFFADYGRFHVAITAPAELEIGATGKRIASEVHGAEVTTVFEQDRVHDFAFSADRRFVRREHPFEGDAGVRPEEREEVARALGVDPASLALRPVQITMLLQPEHLDLEARYLRAVRETLKWLGLWYGAYPYDTLTVVDGPRTAELALGMEYPTLVVVGGRWPAPEIVPNPERVTVHEVAHQYWYGLVGSNETEESWLDEGFTTYSTARVLDRAYGPFNYAPSLLGASLLPFFPDARFGAFERERIAFVALPDSDDVVRPSWLYRSRASYGVNSYSRPATVLRALEDDLGSDVFLKAMREYHARFRFGHPTSDDFRRTVEGVSRTPLERYFAAHLHSPEVLDYAVAEVSSRPHRARVGYSDEGRLVTEAEAQPDGASFDDQVVLERRGALVHPVRAVIALDDGTERVVSWDGRYRFERVAFTSKARVVSARLDPPLRLDVDPTNDSRTARLDLRPALAFGSHASFLVETLIQLLGGLL